jgi:hypothetical protein
MNFPGLAGPHEKWTPCNAADLADELGSDGFVDGSVLRTALRDAVLKGEARAVRQSDAPCGFRDGAPLKAEHTGDAGDGKQAFPEVGEKIDRRAVPDQATGCGALDGGKIITKCVIKT